MSDTAGLIIAGIIGAGGAVVTQIIASVVSGKRDAKRFGWERWKQEREWEIQASERFLNLKQQLYSDFIRVVDQYIFAVIRVINNPDSHEAELTRLPRPRELQQIHANIELIASAGVQEVVSDCYTAILQVAVHLKDMGEEIGPLADEAQQARADVLPVLKRDLRGEREVVKQVKRVAARPPSPEEAAAWWRRKLNKERHP
jgi:hypothetical protein